MTILYHYYSRLNGTNNYLHSKVHIKTRKCYVHGNVFVKPWRCSCVQMRPPVDASNTRQERFSGKQTSITKFCHTSVALERNIVHELDKTCDSLSAITSIWFRDKTQQKLSQNKGDSRSMGFSCLRGRGWVLNSSQSLMFTISREWKKGNLAYRQIYNYTYFKANKNIPSPGQNTIYYGWTSVHTANESAEMIWTSQKHL